jgi:hypothetical protein
MWWRATSDCGIDRSLIKFGGEEGAVDDGVVGGYAFNRARAHGGGGKSVSFGEVVGRSRSQEDEFVVTEQLAEETEKS